MLQLQVRLEQIPIPLGYLIRDDHGALSFVYDADYLAQNRPLPLSLSLPLKDAPYRDSHTRAYFGNLIQENDQLDQVMKRYQLGREDIAGLLEHLGADCPGAISCLPLDSDPVKVPGNLAEDYDILEPELVIEVVDRLAKKKPLPEEFRDPSPLAGVQNKIAICALESGVFAMPKPGLGVPTTHILKVPAIADRKDAEREKMSAILAKKAGLDVAVPSVLEIGEHKALLIERFDRSISTDGFVTRIHQEDFMQAAGLPRDLKYERRGSNDYKFSTETILSILQQCAQPAQAIQNFLLATFFNLAIGNNDNHGKNHALIYDMGPVPRLAPLYDMLPILLSNEYTDELAFNIGNAKFAKDISGSDIEAFFAQFGREKKAALRFQQNEIANLFSKVEKASSEILQGIDQNFDDLVGRELDRLAGVMGLDIPVRERDFFASTGGGWNMN